MSEKNKIYTWDTASHQQITSADHIWYTGVHTYVRIDVYVPCHQRDPININNKILKIINIYLLIYIIRNTFMYVTWFWATVHDVHLHPQLLKFEITIVCITRSTKNSAWNLNRTVLFINNNNILIMIKLFLNIVLFKGTHVHV